ncbi:MAG: bifunctional homocysteine S-methyltransferase/methylenetetrahydrofolate reductase [Paenibacillaceae bacterium]|nr:bifunctional homocysteine S-methyltransferase/methylenetetrahydrofolate reductase [Paenibacillaceae bacterium]
MNVRDVLREAVVIADGAMGTYVVQRGCPIGVSVAGYNVQQPEMIRAVHRQYVEAGAQLVRTNTFGASRAHLDVYGLGAQFDAIHAAAVALARDAGGTYVFGSIGPAPQHDADRAVALAVEQADALLGHGVDGLWCETYGDIEEAVRTVQALRARGGHVIVCTLAVSALPPDAWCRLADAGADVVGLNCRTGPYGMHRLLVSIEAPVPLAALPNAGMPSWQDGAYAYPASPAYFGTCAGELVGAGVRLIGGCCGTTPEHIQSVAQHVRQAALGALPVHSTSPIVVRPARPPSPSIVDTVRARHTVLVELDPPRLPQMDAFWRGASALRDAGADAITLADNSLAMTRVSNMAIAAQMQARIGVRPLPHIACRDRNALGMHAHVYGLHALDIDHVLVVTGDPASFGDLPGAKSVFDMTSFSLIKGIKQLNDGIAFSGKPLAQPTRFVIGCALNPNVKHLDKAIVRLEKKIAAGCDFVMTQPIYDRTLLHRLYAMTRHIRIPIFIGIMPFTSGRNAAYLHNEVPGISLTDDVLRRMQGLEGVAGREMGLCIARELIDEAMPLFRGLYIITPFMAVDLSVALTRYVHAEGSRV